MDIQFEWDENKSRANIQKHGVSFDEAKAVFYDFLSVTIPDPDHSRNEFRYLTIGCSIKNKVLVVSYTDRNNIIRIINARLATKYERKQYEEGTDKI